MDDAGAYLDPEVEEQLSARRARAEGCTTRRESVARASCAVAVVAGAGGFALVHGTRPFHALLFVGLAACYALASRLEFEVGPGSAVPTELVVVPMLLLLPAPVVPAAVVLGLGVPAALDVVRRRTSWQTGCAKVASAGFALAAAGAALALGEPGVGIGTWALLPLVLLAQLGGDFVVASIIEGTALGVTPRQLAGPLRHVFAVDVLLAPLGLAVAAAAAGTSELAVLLPLPALIILNRLARERAAALGRSLELSRAYHGTALLLGDVIECDDDYTGEHSRAVVELSVAVARRLRLSPEERRLTELVALLHDVGKIRIPNEIIRKPDALTAAERTLIETHTVLGQEMLMRVGGLLEDAGRLVRSSHERWDGTGYPDRLAGSEIPLVSRIVCCADAYDAMTSDRPYRAALSREAAIEELRRCAGTQFDPEVVDALLAETARRVVEVRRPSLRLVARPASRVQGVA